MAPNVPADPAPFAVGRVGAAIDVLAFVAADAVLVTSVPDLCVLQALSFPVTPLAVAWGGVSGGLLAVLSPSSLSVLTACATRDAG